VQAVRRFLPELDPVGDDADGAPGDKFAAIMAYRDGILKLLLLFNARSEQAIKASDFRFDIQEFDIGLRLVCKEL
jgi:hypothetical protein